jgi:integrase
MRRLVSPSVSSSKRRLHAVSVLGDYLAATGLDWRTITAHDFEPVLADLGENARCYLVCGIRRYYREAVELRLTDRNPAQAVPCRAQSSGAFRLSNSDIQTTLQMVARNLARPPWDLPARRDIALIAVLMHGKCPTSVLASLCWGDLSDGILQVGTRRVPLTPPALERLEEWRAGLRASGIIVTDDDPLFCSLHMGYRFELRADDRDLLPPLEGITLVDILRRRLRTAGVVPQREDGLQRNIRVEWFSRSSGEDIELCLEPVAPRRPRIANGRRDAAASLAT